VLSGVEVVELKTVDCFVVTVVEKRCILSQFPVLRRRDNGKAAFFTSRHFDSVHAQVFAFFDRGLGPQTGSEIVASLHSVASEEVVTDCAVNLGSPTLQEENREVVGDFHQLLEITPSLLLNAVEVRATVTHLHHGDAGAVPAHELVLSFLNHFCGQAAGACAEVKDLLLHKVLLIIISP